MWLWPPVMQVELDKFRKYQNNHRMRKQKEKILPSGVSPGFAYSCPSRWGGRNCLQPVDVQIIDKVLADLDPEMKKHTDWGVPEELASAARDIFDKSGIKEVTMRNIWVVFGYILSRLIQMGFNDSEDFEISEGSDNTEGLDGSGSDGFD